MSKIALSPNNSGTGVFTIQSPSSNTNRTLDLPDASGTLALTSDIPTGGGASDLPDGSTTTPAVNFAADTNTGIYRPAADTIGFVCGGTEDFRVDGDGQLWNTINSQVGTDYTTLYKGYLCRAWVNFNGTGTVAIRASGNVSSITDNNTGNYTVNFTTAMPDANYGAAGMAKTGLDNYGYDVMIINQTTSGIQVFTAQEGGGAPAFDNSIVCVAIFR